MNETGFALDLDWWREVERLPIEQKWEVLAKKQLGKRLPRGHPASRALADLTNDRHLVAHHKGLKQEDDSFTFAAPPVVEHGGRSHIRVHFDAARAKTSVERAKLVVEHLVAPT